ncbi:MAG: hypothetical protein ACMXYG_07715 [Candidatus Woesearchaeota archaeon]
MLKKILALHDSEAPILVDTKMNEFLNTEAELLKDDPLKEIEKEINDEIDDEIDDEINDFLDDPEGIAIPWEEKYGKKKKNDKKGKKSSKKSKK